MSYHLIEVPIHGFFGKVCLPYILDDSSLQVSSRRLCQAVWRRMYATVTNLFDLGRDSYPRMPECLPNSENGDLDKIHIEPSLIFFFESIFGLDSLTWLGAITSS